MLLCICIDDDNSMFRVIKGAHYWQPVIEKTINEGDILYFEKTNSGVYLSLKDNKDLSFIFLTESDFLKHFEDISLRRDNNINKLLY